MNTNFEEDCLRIYDKLFESGEEVYGGAKSVIQECIDFGKKWNIVIGAENIDYLSESDFKNEFELTKSKLLRKTKKCVFYGNTSSGKSTLVNSILAKNVLATGFGSTSNSFVEIRASPTNDNYFVINDEKKSIEKLIEIIDIESSNHLENGSLITMYYNKNECKLLKDDVVIIDAPGSNSTFLHNNSMEEYFKDADVVVLVVNAQSGITTSDEQFFKDFRTRYRKLNLIIVYNFWDFVNPNGDNIRLYEQCKNKAKNILCNMLQLTDAEADSSIFFISASERIEIQTGFIYANSGSQWNERNESFERFLNYLQAKMSESLSTKNYTYLINLLSLMISTINQCQNCISQMKDKKLILQQNIDIELKKLKELDLKISPKISKILNDSFEKLLIQGLKILKKEEPELVKKLKSILKFSLKNYSLVRNENREMFIELLKSITEENYKKLEMLNKNLTYELNLDDTDIPTFQNTILNEIYFPFYFKLNDSLNFIHIEDFINYLKDINLKINVGKGFALVLITVVSLAAGAGTGCAMFSVARMTIPTVAITASAAAESAAVSSTAAAGVKVLSTVGGGVVASSGVGGAIGVVKSLKEKKIFQLPFQFAWNNEETLIKKLWDPSELDEENNYKVLTDSVNSYVTQLITSIEEKSTKIQNDLNKITEELQKLKDKIDL